MPYSFLVYNTLLKDMKEVNIQQSSILELEEQKQALLLEISKQNEEIAQLIDKSMQVNNDSFYMTVGICAFILLTGAAVMFFFTNGDIARVLAEHMPKLTDAAVKANLDAVETTSIVLGNKLDKLELDLVKLGELSIEISNRNAVLETQMEAILEKLGVVNLTVSSDILTQVSQFGVF